MPGAPRYDEKRTFQLQVVSQSPHTFAYRLWVGRPTDPDWTLLDEGNIKTPPRDYGPYPTGTKIDYCLSIGDSPNTNWQVQAQFNQNGTLLACSPPPEHGTTNGKGVAGCERVITLS
jgi:hypothetical protein